MNIFNNIFIKFVQFYKFIISPLMGDTCRYFPTCSDYSIETFKKFNFFKALILTLKRISSCHPIKFLGGGEGLDPVEKEMKVKK